MSVQQLEMRPPDTDINAAFELLDIGVGVFDAEDRLQYCNHAFRTLRRYPVTLCAAGAPLESLVRYNAERGDFGPGDLDRLVAERLGELHDVDAPPIEREMADGQVLRVRSRRYGAGSLLITFEDQTSERRARDALAASEERHMLVSRATSDGIYDWNVREDVLYVSENLTRILDFDLKQKASRMWVERVHPDDYDAYAKATREHFKGETEAIDCEYRVRGSNGGYRWIHDRGVGTRDASGRVVRLVGAVRDITDFKEARAELDRTESRLMASLATIADGILLVDADDRVRLWNDRYYEIFCEAAGGADLRDVIVEGRPFFDMIREGYELGMFRPHPAGIDGWIEARRRTWAQPVGRWELELGNGTWILLNERRMPDGGHVSVYTDITELKRREEEAQAARTRFEEAIEAISTGFALYDNEDRLTVWNTRFREYFADIADVFTPGLKFRDMISASVERGLFPAAENDPDGFLASLLEKRSQCSGQVRENLLSNGTWLQITDHRTGEGGLVSIYTDVTELKTKQVELEAALQEFHAVLENIGYGIIFMGADLRARIVNRAFREMWGIPQSFIDQRPSMRELIEYNRRTGVYGVADEHWDEWVAQRLDEIAQGDIPARELLRADGRALSFQGIALPDGGRMLTYFDITDMKTHEAAITRAKEAAESALHDLSRAQERLVQAEKMASLGQLTAGIAHEIKNPLNFVNNFAKLADEMVGELAEILEAPLSSLDPATRDDALDLLQTTRDNLGKINHHGRRADAIVKNMLLHARHGPSECHRANLNGIAEEAINLAYHGARAEHPELKIEMTRDLSDAVGEIDCYPQDLMRVFLNLISNGIYAAGQRAATAGDGFAPTVTVRSRPAADGIVVQITDNGVGIPPDLKDRIFTPFFTTKPAGEGTGLGLSLSYDIVVKQHGGDIAVESEPGEFTTFTIELPIGSDAAESGT